VAKFTTNSDAEDRALNMGLDLRRGTHGSVMPKSGALPSRILSADEVGVSEVHSGMSDKSRAYYTAEQRPDISKGLGQKSAEENGWTWANFAADAGGRRPGGLTRPRSVVYNVEPSGRVEPDVNLPGTGAMTADSLDVKDVQWIPPPRTGSPGMQGTLPHLNWNEFAPPYDLMERNWHSVENDPTVSPTERIRRRAQAQHEERMPDRPEQVPGQTRMF
jgi:hypothetical protein